LARQALPPPGFRLPVPDSEVTARPHRRRFTADYKRSIVEQADAAQDAGAVGALLRREGLYSSHLATWRRRLKQGGIDALTPKKARSQNGAQPAGQTESRFAGRPCPPDQEAEECRTDQLIIEVQKVAALLGNPIPSIRIDEENS
jgi:transposase-like protein